VADKYMNVVGQ